MMKSVPIKPVAAQRLAAAIKAVNEATANYQLVASLVLESYDLGSAQITGVDTDKNLLHLDVPEEAK